MKQGFLSVLAMVGYGMVILVATLALVLGIIFGVKGIGPKDEAVVGLETSIEPSASEGIFVTQNNTINISSELDEHYDAETDTNFYDKKFKMVIKGTRTPEGETVDYSSQKINLVLTKSELYSDVVSKEETPLFFVTTNELGQEVETVSLVVQVNEEFTLKLATYKATNPYIEDAEEKDYIRGGDVFLQARTINNPYKAEPRKIQVDVPVETLVVTATTYNKNGVFADVTDVVNNTAKLFETVVLTSETDTNNENIWNKDRVVKYTGNTTTLLKNGESYYYNQTTSAWESVWSLSDTQAFIKNSEIKLGTKTFPENAVAAVAGMSKIGFVEFSASSLSPGTQYDSDAIRQGIFRIRADGTTNTGNFPVSAKIPALFKSGKDYKQADYIKASDIVFRVEPVEVESITIENNKFTSGLVVDVYDSATFSATELNGQTDSLNLKIKSKHFVHGDDPSQEHLSNIMLHAVVGGNVDKTLIKNGFKDAFNIVSQQMEEENNRVWTLENLRDYILDEEVDLYFSFNTEFDEHSPYAHIKVSIGKTSPTVFDYVGQDSLILTKTDGFYLEMVDGYETNVADQIDTTQTDKVNLDTTTDEKEYLTFNGTPTYKKWVYFAKNVNLNENEVGSRILNLSATGQLAYEENSVTWFSQTIEPLGAGTVDMVAMLVLTDKDGMPVDCYYNQILNTDDTTFVLLKDITELGFNSNSYEGKFVVVFQPTVQNEIYYQRITVTEKLTTMKAFYDDTDGEVTDAEDFVDLVVDGSTVLIPLNKTQTIKTLYLVGNSCLALEYVKETYDFEDPFATETESVIEVTFGDVQVNESFSTPNGNTYKIRYVTLTVKYLGYPPQPKPNEDSTYEDFDINFRNNVIEGETQRTFGILNCKAIVVEVSSISVDYNAAILESTPIDSEDKHIDIDTLRVRATVQDNKAQWKFAANNAVFGLLKDIGYTYNVVPAHDYQTLVPTKDVVNEYQIFALSNNYLIDFYNNPTTNYDKTDYRIALEKVETDGELTGLRFVLKEGWQRYISGVEAKNIVLVYSVRAANGNSVVTTKCFLLNMAECVDGVVTSDQSTESRGIDLASARIYSNWDYKILEQPLNIDYLTKISVSVDYGQKNLTDVVSAILTSEHEMKVQLAEGYTTQQMGPKVMETQDKFSVVVRLFFDENVVYEFDYVFSLQNSNVYRMTE